MASAATGVAGVGAREVAEVHDADDVVEIASSDGEAGVGSAERRLQRGAGRPVAVQPDDILGRDHDVGGPCSAKQFAATLLKTEIDLRDAHGTHGRIKAGKTPARKTLEEFDFAFQAAFGATPSCTSASSTSWRSP